MEKENIVLGEIKWDYLKFESGKVELERIMSNIKESNKNVLIKEFFVDKKRLKQDQIVILEPKINEKNYSVCIPGPQCNDLFEENVDILKDCEKVKCTRIDIKISIKTGMSENETFKKFIDLREIFVKKSEYSKMYSNLYDSNSGITCYTKCLLENSVGRLYKYYNSEYLNYEIQIHLLLGKAKVIFTNKSLFS